MYVRCTQSVWQDFAHLMLSFIEKFKSLKIDLIMYIIRIIPRKKIKMIGIYKYKKRGLAVWMCMWICTDIIIFLFL